MKTTSTIALTLTLGLTLSACQAIFGPRTAHLDSAGQPQIAEHQINPALDQGRQLLKAGRIAQAVELLRVAQRDPSSMAEASNGLGVAYAKLGRHDLADRYFKMALSLEPSDTRFAANMIRLQRDYDLLTKRQEEAVRLAKKAEEVRLARLARVVDQGRIQRVSRGQVAIRTHSAASDAAPKTEVFAMNARNGAESAPRPEVNVEVGVESNDETTSRGYPVTIDFKRSLRPRANSTDSQNQYPVRVYIGA
ncbi:tetratricopeptide repeat protein [Altererythrobacter sp. MF3-039]|uniref:tetratricopeptide repeat protein n=1 Tax=Altererythrobacter sp. MF3-039 TaxID=3252901 RepID=UPI00390C8639